MLEVNAIYFILLLEGFALLALILVIWVLIAIFRLRRKRRALRELAARIEKRAAARALQTESFLQAVYRLEGDELQAAMREIGEREDEFFTLLLASLKRASVAHIGELDAALDRVVDSYKCLQPRTDDAEEEQTRTELQNLRGENQQLRSDLAQAKNKMSDLVSEFANMFGGGKDHQLMLDEVRDKLAAMHAENQIDVKL